MLKPPPAAPGLPVLGNALTMMGDVQRFLVDTYRQMGPVFRVRALNQRFTIMAGGAALRLPRYRRARAEILAFARDALAARQAAPGGSVPDLLDRALDAVDEHGDPYPLEVRAGMALQGYFAGISTVAYLYSFMLSELLRRPDIRQRVTAEVDAAYEGEHLPFDSLRGLTALHGLVLETLRVCPPAPGSTRMATRASDFAGHRIAEGTRVLVATSVATFAMLVHHLSPELRHPRRPLRIRASPGPNPGKRFTVTVP